MQKNNKLPFSASSLQTKKQAKSGACEIPTIAKTNKIKTDPSYAFWLTPLLSNQKETVQGHAAEALGPVTLPSAS